MDLEEIYITAKSIWQPSADDDMDNAWFYSSFAAVNEVCRVMGENTDNYSHLIHHAVCWTRGGDWLAIVADLKSSVPSMPEKPNRYYSSGDHEPIYDENRPRDMFTEQFRVKYPGKRINSKFANERWEAVKAKAEQYARDEYRVKLEQWQVREDRRNAECQVELNKWHEACNRVMLIRAFIAKLT